MPARALAFSLLALCAACGQDRTAPQIMTLEPSVASNRVETDITIVGQEFYNFAELTLDDDTAPNINRAWTVQVGDADPLEARRESLERLAFVLPAGYSPGVYDVSITAPDGLQASLADALTVVDGVVETALSIETAADGTGDLAGPQVLGIGESVELFAVVRIAGIFDRAASDTTWMTGSLGSIEEGPSSNTTFKALSAGAGSVTATSAVGTAMVDVLVLGAQIEIADAPGGTGVRVDSRSLSEGEEITLFAVQVDDAGEFLTDVVATWSVSGGIGAVDVGPASSTTLMASAGGMGRVTATSTLGVAETGELTVTNDDPVTLVSDDPGDGSLRASVFRYGEDLAVGPSDDGTSVRLMDAVGASPMRRSLSFFRDEDDRGSESRNDAASPYPSIGAEGCAPDTIACGPDNENGRGLFTSWSIRGQDWVVASGARDRDQNYIYMSDSASELQFSYVDLTLVLGGRTERMTASHMFEGSLYMGFNDNGGSRPFFVRLDTTPVAPGLDARASDVENLQARSFPNFVSDVRGTIDSIWDYRGRLHVANDSAWVRATRRTPRDADSNAGDWMEMTPTAVAYGAKTSVHHEDNRPLESADLAAPFMATFKDRLFVARNTTDGPQLWGCNPASSGDPMQCEGDDFVLVGANETEDAQLTTFDNPNNTAITLLAATADHLYVGFDNAVDGIVLFRTTVGTASAQGDFSGGEGCDAALHPATCAGIGANGFGVASNQVIFDARAIAFDGRQFIYLTTGDGSSPYRVYRIGP